MLPNRMTDTLVTLDLLTTRGCDVTADDEFVRSLKRGEADAYEALVRRFEGPLYRYFLASHGDAQLAGEQSADCFSDLVESLPKMSGGSAQCGPSSSLSPGMSCAGAGAGGRLSSRALNRRVKTLTTGRHRTPPWKLRKKARG
jgi:hypothetical protein